jgi:hypothetical protein
LRRFDNANFGSSAVTWSLTPADLALPFVAAISEIRGINSYSVLAYLVWQVQNLILFILKHDNDNYDEKITSQSHWILVWEIAEEIIHRRLQPFTPQIPNQIPHCLLGYSTPG